MSKNQEDTKVDQITFSLHEEQIHLSLHKLSRSRLC